MLLQAIFVLISLALYVLSPQQYSFGLCLTCGILYLLNIIYYYYTHKKKNFFDFDTIFSISFFITFFIYPILLFPINPEYFAAFSFGFNENTVTKATSLSLIGYSSYILGRCYNTSINKEKSQNIGIVHVKDKFKLTSFIYYILLLTFILLGGLSQLQALYNNTIAAENPIVNYFAAILLPIVTIAIVLQTFYIKQSKRTLKSVSKIFFITLIATLLLFLSTGSRTLPLAIALIILWIFTYYYYNLSLLKVFTIILCGCLILSLVGLLRIDESTDNLKFVDIFMDLIINNRNTFLAIELVDENGITYGKSLLAYILRAIPFLSGIVHSLFNLSTIETSSSYIFTYETFGSDLTIGVGSNIIADLYLAFGVTGVIIFMLLLGMFIKFLEREVEYNNVFAILTYAIMMSQSVFLTRSEYFFPLNIIVLSLFSYVLISNITKIFINETNLIGLHNLREHNSERRNRKSNIQSHTIIRNT